ncbi:MAG: GspH/FimT family pseudopilin [Anaerolinea sp.]|nr:GspH/FimT family pseudopilin [Anaerolinea sp.]
MRKFSAIGTRPYGLTLIELMIGLTLLSVLVTLAAPSFQRQIASSQLTTASNDLLLAIARARSESIRLGSRVTVCKSANGSGCDTTSSGWETGWITFVDTTRSGTNAVVDAGETITFRASAVTGSVKIVGNADTANYVSYAPDGRAKLMNGGFQAGRIRVCSPSPALNDDNRARDICISNSGRAVIVTPTGVSAACNTPATGTCV